MIMLSASGQSGGLPWASSVAGVSCDRAVNAQAREGLGRYASEAGLRSVGAQREVRANAKYILQCYAKDGFIESQINQGTNQSGQQLQRHQVQFRWRKNSRVGRGVLRVSYVRS
jgi:hypothetical protein